MPVGVLVGPDHHHRRVPADEGADAPLDVLVAREPRLLLGRDGVDVRRADRGREADLRLAGPLEQLGEQEAGAGLAVRVDDGVEAVEPLLRLDRVDVGQLVDEAVEDHGPILASDARGMMRPIGVRTPVRSCTPTGPAPGTPARAAGPGRSRRTACRSRLRRRGPHDQPADGDPAPCSRRCGPLPGPVVVVSRLDLRRQLLPRPVVGGLAAQRLDATPSASRSPTATCGSRWSTLVQAREDDVAFRWVKGHSGDPMNDLVDRLAVEAAASAAVPR